ncbi:MAG: hypothetical protein IPO09_17565 [Anaeromyxobacter sp.]|nr:hypothetical protein [Anaeromyxobacter sp.]MBL0276492.1 hypothetical protein [Anaeromyxobacter sp.]
MPTQRARFRRAVRRTTSSLGELIAAVHDGLRGTPALRAWQTTLILASPVVANRLSRSIRSTS